MRILALCSVSLILLACSKGTVSSPEPATSSEPVTPVTEPAAPVIPDFGSMTVIQNKVGSGTQAVAGKPVTVHYTGWLLDDSAQGRKGEKFDSSRDRDRPFRFDLGQGKVIKGWDKGVEGMRVGGSRTLIIPPEMAYGARGRPPVIPASATLVFDVELLGVE